MYAIKGSWVGKTFALAKSNDSEGRKSRIRRSKEERKTMVESFIKNYQRLNNGNFPSLNLTHKEVGGSFYTVREIVREVIQENRVLGPAKLTPEEQNADRFSENYLLGSISMEPRLYVSVATSETALVSNHSSISEDLILNSNGQCTVPKSQRFNGQIVNESQEDERNNEADELICEELQVIETFEADEIKEKLEASSAKLGQILEDVIVETFPLRPVSKPTFSLDENSDEVKKYSNGTVKEEAEHSKVSSVLSQSSPDNCSHLLDDAGVPLSETESGFRNEIVTVTLEDQLLESPHLSSIKKGIMHDIEDGIDLKESPDDDISPFGTSEQGQAIAGVKSNIDLNGIPAIMNGMNTSRTEELISKVASVKEIKTDVQPSSSCQKGSKPTLDRINLESWEGASKKPAEPETNPVLAIFKAFVAAFVKFWSE